jgi:hypothetical protein
MSNAALLSQESQLRVKSNHLISEKRIFLRSEEEKITHQPKETLKLRQQVKDSYYHEDTVVKQGRGLHQHCHQRREYCLEGCEGPQSGGSMC